MQVNLTGEAVQFTGQDIPGWEIEHLGVDDAGLPVRQARQKFPGGEQIAHQGDYIVTLESGQQIIVHALPKEKESFGYRTPTYADFTHDSAPEAPNGDPDLAAAGDHDDVQAQAAAAPEAQAEVLPEEGE